MFKDKRKTVKMIVGCVVGVTAGSVINLALKQNVVTTKTSEKIAVAIGSFMIGDYIGAKVANYAERSCDDIFSIIDSVKAMQKETTEDASQEEIIASPEQTE